MKFFSKQMIGLTLGLLAYAIIELIIYEMLHAVSDKTFLAWLMTILSLIGPILYLLCSGFFIFKEKSDALKKRLLKTIIALCCFIVALGSFLYLWVLFEISINYT